MQTHKEQQIPQDPDTTTETDPDADRPLTVDGLVAAADDPSSKKQKTGERQAAENREVDPPA